MHEAMLSYKDGRRELRRFMPDGEDGSLAVVENTHPSKRQHGSGPDWDGRDREQSEWSDGNPLREMRRCSITNREQDEGRKPEEDLGACPSCLSSSIPEGSVYLPSFREMAELMMWGEYLDPKVNRLARSRDCCSDSMFGGTISR